MDTDFTPVLKNHNLSLTAVRLAVLQALHDHPHSDANTIFAAVQRRIPTATLQAVYNNLNALTEAGILQEIKPKGRVSLYETRVGDNHHHIVCRQCGHIEDTDCAAVAPCLSPAKDHGYVIDQAEVIFWGTCPACQNTASNNHTGEDHEKCPEKHR
ncbi:Fur family transcriptional regulator [Micavibrio aeruginosavorus]|uniref:Fur family transcriptional regulator n=1 Tax=Micavibrio aeruginosavorus TaxID=349221 RepID=UPI003F4AD6CB